MPAFEWKQTFIGNSSTIGEVEGSGGTLFQRKSGVSAHRDCLVSSECGVASIRTIEGRKDATVVLEA